jgi:hypothetical protein
MRRPRFRLRTLMVVVAVAGFISLPMSFIVREMVYEAGQVHRQELFRRIPDVLAEFPCTSPTTGELAGAMGESIVDVKRKSGGCR